MVAFYKSRSGYFGGELKTARYKNGPLAGRGPSGTAPEVLIAIAANYYTRQAALHERQTVQGQPRVAIYVLMYPFAAGTCPGPFARRVSIAKVSAGKECLAIGRINGDDLGDKPLLAVGQEHRLR